MYNFHYNFYYIYIYRQDQKTKATILEQLKTHGPDYGLDRITFLSFLYRSGYQLPSSASDIVYAVNGILNHIIDNERVEDRVFKALDCLSMQKQSVFEYGVQCAREQVSGIITCRSILNLLSSCFQRKIYARTDYVSSVIFLYFFVRVVDNLV